jgi:transcriptional regulator with XRE-family HTH domain
MAAQLGITASYLSEIERGLKIPRGETLVKLASFFGTTVEAIYEDKADLRIMQISAAWTGDQLRVACLMNDGSIQMAYPKN